MSNQPFDTAPLPGRQRQNVEDPLKLIKSNLDELYGIQKNNSEELPGFTMIRELGHGGMGSVWLAEQDTPRRLCAIKLLRKSMSGLYSRFETEANLAAKIHHKSIATVYDFSRQNETAYLVTEYIEGYTLADILAIAGFVSVNDDRNGTQKPSEFYATTRSWLKILEAIVCLP